MVPMLSECWRMLAYLLQPEGDAGAQVPAGPPCAGVAKTLFWACLAVLVGLGLARLR